MIYEMIVFVVMLLGAVAILAGCLATGMIMFTALLHLGKERREAKKYRSESK